MCNNKAVGIDNLPYEVLKNTESSLLLTELFHKEFQTHIIPSLWRYIIKPIPKGSTTDPRQSLQYRNITLLSTIYKLYTCTLNNRIVSYMEENGLYAEEQNGFRQGRSCSEQLFVLITIIRNRKLQRKSTFTAFLDAEKAFDRVDRELLLFKLLNVLGIKGYTYMKISKLFIKKPCVALMSIIC